MLIRLRSTTHRLYATVKLGGSTGTVVRNLFLKFSDSLMQEVCL